MDASKRWPVWPQAIEADLDPRDQALKDILDGLAVLYENPFIRDLRNTVLAYPDSRIGIALNKKQTACKKWLVEELHGAVGPEIGSVHILAGWYGLLGAMLLSDRRFAIEQLTVIDADPSCEPVALSLNASQAEQGRFRFRQGDIYDIDYCKPPVELGRPDLIINTSCEHLDRFDDWYSQLPAGQLVALQSNDYYAIPEHVNSVDNVDAFRDQAPMSALLYSGTLDVGKYRRFLLIGRV